jgi:DNA-binding MarR family transcriptional regulator
MPDGNDNGEADRGESVSTGSLRLGDYLPYQLAVASNQVSRMVARSYQSRFGLTIWEWRVIAVLAEEAGHSGQSLGEAAAMDKVSVSRSVSGLIKRGLVARVRNEADRRSSVLSLTEAGWDIYRKVEPVALEAENALIEDLDADDLARIGRLLAHLKRRAGAIGEV